MIRHLAASIWLCWSCVAWAADRPNILWLTAEDLSPRLGCYGDATASTPNLDRLAQESLRFTRAFSVTAVCAPSWHTIITGLYPMQSGAQYQRTMSKTAALDEIKDPGLRQQAIDRPVYEATPPEGVRCFTEYLRAAGYYCTNDGKEDYQFKAPGTAWDESSKNAHYKNRAPDQPFFAVFNQNATHESGMHGTTRRNPRVTDPAKISVPSFLPDTPVVRDDIARHYDNLIELDNWIVRKLDELEQAGLADSTWVFFFSDHGDGLPRCKRWVYDSGTRVPLLIRPPGGPRSGEVDDSLMSFIDLAPTVLSLAGLDRPNYMTGRVFVGPQKAPPPDHVFMHCDRMDDTSHDTIRAVRDEQFRYVRNYRPDLPYLQPVAYRDRIATMGEIYRVIESKNVPRSMWQWASSTKPVDELYDTKTDPDEVNNLADNPKFAARKARMRAALEEWVKRIEDPLATEELEVLRTRVWPPHGKQPTTAWPMLMRDANSQLFSLSCDSPGASLGYRTGALKSWKVYTEPFEFAGGELEVVAHRLGWKPSRATFSVESNK
jgi:arylsulfatase A-like enzyme